MIGINWSILSYQLNRINWSEIQADINDFARRLRLKEFFQNNQTNSTNPSDEVRKRFRCKGTWAPPNGRDAALDAFISAVENDIMCSKPTILDSIKWNNYPPSPPKQ